MNIAAIILGLIDGITLILGKIEALKNIAKQNNELTADQEKQLDDKMQTAFAQLHWQPSTPTPETSRR